MGFEISPSPVRATRLRWPALAFAAALIVVVAAAVSTQAPSPPPSATPAPAAAASRPLGGLLTPPAVPHRLLPSRVQCRQLDAPTCHGLAQAALAVLPIDAPPVTNVTVYRSLLCRNDFDCPPGRLASSRAPSGSVILGFADGGPDAWVDVVTAASAGLEAWIIR